MAVQANTDASASEAPVTPIAVRRKPATPEKKKPMDFLSIPREIQALIIGYVCEGVNYSSLVAQHI